MLELRIEDAFARLTLQRPEVRNAIPLDGWDAIAEKARAAEAAGARLLVLAGEGGAFCAGADLGGFAALQGDPAAASAFREAMRRGIDALASLPIPVVALIEGPCYGAGVALALACDIRLAGPAARFAITPAKMGISYPQEDVARLVALVGAGQAARLLFTGATFDAAEAMRIGLADAPAAEPDAIEAAVAANAPASLAILKRGIGLAAEGVRSDAEQDRQFDALLASDALAALVAARLQR